MKSAALFLLACSRVRADCAAADAGRRVDAAEPAPSPIATAAQGRQDPARHVRDLERAFDGKLAGMADANGPVDLLGATRGV